MPTTVTNPGPMPDPTDYGAYNAWRDAGGVPGQDDAQAPAVDGGDDDGGEFVDPAAEGADQSIAEAEAALAAAGAEGEELEAGEGTGSESDETGAEGTDTAQQTEPKRSKGIEQRFRKQANRIAQLTQELETLKSQLRPDDEDEPVEGAEGGAEGGEQPAAAAAVNLDAPPQLADFDTLEEWREAYKAFNEALIEAAVSRAKREGKAERDVEVAKERQQEHQAEWSRQASRYPDYNEVVTDRAQISPAMAVVMHRDPEAGTRLAYYFGKHPEEAKEIGALTLAQRESDWGPAIALAGIKLGQILAKLPAPAQKGVAATAAGAKAPVKKTATGTKTPTPAASTATRPPAPIRSQAVPSGKSSSFDYGESEDDYGKWEQARERELAAKRR